MDIPAEWPEPMIAVQSLSDGTTIPERYVRAASELRDEISELDVGSIIPIIDISGLVSSDEGECGAAATVQAIAEACREWGFFQVVNHGVSGELVERVRKVWKDFFGLPVEEKMRFANDPRTYIGYGNRLGVDKKSILDWCDYFFLEILPEGLRNHDKWPTNPASCRETIEEYGREIEKLCQRLLKALSLGLGLEEEFLQRAFGGEHCSANCRANFYPKCPQPRLTYGLSPHSDSGGLTVLLADDRVAGFQVRKNGVWFTVQPAPNAFMVNVADQIQVLSNGIYKSVEHRAIVNPSMERHSLAFFYNPNNEMMIKPAAELVTPDSPARYTGKTYKEHLEYIRKNGVTEKLKLQLQLQSMEVN